MNQNSRMHIHSPARRTHLQSIPAFQQLYIWFKHGISLPREWYMQDSHGMLLGLLSPRGRRMQLLSEMLCEGTEPVRQSFTEP